MTTKKSLYGRWGKRVLDVVLSATALLLLSPLLLALALVVRVFLGSPVLFRQKRSGMLRQGFTILKFRTMTDARDERGELLSDSVRLTRLGRWLRATSLDELPELINVLKGDMSLIGPRPLVPQYDAYYRDDEVIRFDVLPGITGWAQVNGRNALSWEQRFAFDAWYVERIGFWLDVTILLRTIGTVLGRNHVHVDTSIAFLSLDVERRMQADESKAEAVDQLPKAPFSTPDSVGDIHHCGFTGVRP
jgi:lipopolysaccharide/colanic/teichoic acid biosynthesis glycosyltransferase